MVWAFLLMPPLALVKAPAGRARRDGRPMSSRTLHRDAVMSILGERLGCSDVGKPYVSVFKSHQNTFRNPRVMNELGAHHRSAFRISRRRSTNAWAA